MDRLPAPPARRSASGFTALPHALLAVLLCLPLTRRELSVLLLVARLTYGCRNARWARLAHADLATVGIGASHAGEVLRSLLARGLLERSGRGQEYRLGDLGRALGDAERLRRLGALVARQLRPSQAKTPAVPKTVDGTLPFRDRYPSRNGSGAARTSWRFDRSQGRFVPRGEEAIDKDIQ